MRAVLEHANDISVAVITWCFSLVVYRCLAPECIFVYAVTNKSEGLSEASGDVIAFLHSPLLER